MRSSPTGSTSIASHPRSVVSKRGAHPEHEPRKVVPSELLKAALEYAEAGLPVFPCKPGGKKPLIPKCPLSKGLSGEALARHARTCGRDGHGHHDATNDPDKIREWWEKTPEANIGVPTGERSGWLVVDQDHPAALDALEEEHGELPATRTHGTGNGGLQFLLKYPPGCGIRNSAGRLAEHLDIRGEGGYVVVPPSRTTRPYEVLDDLPLADPPAWLLRELTAPKKPHTGEGGDRPRVATVVAGEADSGPIPKGQRHDRLKSRLGRAHDRERTLEEFTELALRMNERDCVPPIGSPGDDDPVEDVVRLARFVHSRELCRPQGKRANEEVQRLLMVFEEQIGAMPWPGHSANRFSLLKTWALEARKHGEIHEGGVALSISDGQSAVHNGTSKWSVKRHKRRLREDGVIDTDNEGRGHTDSGKIVLLIPTSGHLDNPTEPGSDTTLDPLGSVVGEKATRQRPPGGGGGVTSQRLAAWSATRARHGKPIFAQGERIGHLGRMGKRAEFAVDELEEAGGRLSQQELASAMGIKRARNMNDSVWLSRLLDAGVVERDAEGYLSLTGGWLAAWDRRRVEDEEEMDRERDRERYRRMSEAWVERVAERAEDLHQKRLHRMALVCHDGEIPADGFVSDLERIEDASDGPVEEPEGAEAFGGPGDAPGGQEAPLAGHTPDTHRIRTERSSADVLEAPERPGADCPEDAPKMHRESPSGHTAGTPPTPPSYYRATTALLPEGGDLSNLAVALGRFLERNPRRANEYPSWLGTALWAEGYTEGTPKPTAAEVSAALGELEETTRGRAA